MTVKELQASGYALADAIKAHTDAICQFIVEQEVDYRREFGAVTDAEAAALLSCSKTTIRQMHKDGRLAQVGERTPLWSIHELLHLTPSQRRRKSALRVAK